MRNFSSSLCAVLLFVLLFSCNNPVELPENYVHRFNVEEYFIAEAELLNLSGTGIVKEIYKNNLTETVVIENPDWKKELQPFMQIKLNKPAQINSFSADSTNRNGQLAVEYSAKEPNEDLRKLSIYFTGSTPDSIVAIRSTSNIYYRSDDTITYLGNGNYKIITKNKPRIGKEISFVLAGTSVPQKKKL